MTLHISDLQVSYAGRTVLTDVTLGPVENGTITGLLGPNAAGKSTLVKTIAGLKKASGGRCQVLSEGREVTGPELRDVIGYVPQDLLTSASLTAFESDLGPRPAPPNRAPAAHPSGGRGAQLPRGRRYPRPQPRRPLLRHPDRHRPRQDPGARPPRGGPDSGPSRAGLRSACESAYRRGRPRHLPGGCVGALLAFHAA